MTAVVLMATPCTELGQDKPQSGKGGKRLVGRSSVTCRPTDDDDDDVQLDPIP